MAVWLYGCMAVWLYGCMGSQNSPIVTFREMPLPSPTIPVNSKVEGTGLVLKNKSILFLGSCHSCLASYERVMKLAAKAVRSGIYVVEPREATTFSMLPKGSEKMLVPAESSPQVNGMIPDYVCLVRVDSKLRAKEILYSLDSIEVALD